MRRRKGEQRPAYAGLIYPIAVCLMTLVVGGLFIRETNDHRIDSDVHPFARCESSSEPASREATK